MLPENYSLLEFNVKISKFKINTLRTMSMTKNTKILISTMKKYRTLL